jgi:hypothetical protein
VGKNITKLGRVLMPSFGAGFSPSFTAMMQLGQQAREAQQRNKLDSARVDIEQEQLALMKENADVEQQRWEQDFEEKQRINSDVIETNKVSREGLGLENQQRRWEMAPASKEAIDMTNSSFGSNFQYDAGITNKFLNEHIQNWLAYLGIQEQRAKTELERKQLQESGDYQKSMFQIAVANNFVNAHRGTYDTYTKLSGEADYWKQLSEVSDGKDKKEAIDNYNKSVFQLQALERSIPNLPDIINQYGTYASIAMYGGKLGTIPYAFSGNNGTGGKK